MRIMLKSNTKSLEKLIHSITALDGRTVKAGVPDGEQALYAPRGVTTTKATG